MDGLCVCAARFLASAALCRYSSDRDNIQGEHWKDGSVPQIHRPCDKCCVWSVGLFIGPPTPRVGALPSTSVGFATPNYELNLFLGGGRQLRRSVMWDAVVLVWTATILAYAVIAVALIIGRWAIRSHARATNVIGIPAEFLRNVQTQSVQMQQSAMICSVIIPVTAFYWIAERNIECIRTKGCDHFRGESLQ